MNSRSSDVGKNLELDTNNYKVASLPTKTITNLFSFKTRKTVAKPRDMITHSSVITITSLCTLETICARGTRVRAYNSLN